MKAIKTSKVLPGNSTIYDLLDKELNSLEEGNILAVTSKVVALCENRMLHQDTGNEDDLVAQESDWYIQNFMGELKYYITIAYHTLILTAGVDSSNSDNHFVLLPKNPQLSADRIREYLVRRFGLKDVGVIITDSTSQPLRRGVIGVALAHSGFKALHSYVGKPDVFGALLKVSQSNITGGLAAAAVLIMGEGAEQTPLCLISDVDFINFQDHSPTSEELQYLNFPVEEDLFAPLLEKVTWRAGRKD